MTTPVRPYRPRRQQTNYSLRRWLVSGAYSAWFYLNREHSLEDIWEEHCDNVVAHHIRRRPGSRPKMWWRFSAPEQRQRRGGIGTPLHECSNHSPLFEYGIPAAWRYFDDHMTCGVPISQTHPPRYESQATFLKRHRLLLPGESKRLSRIEFEPVVLRIFDGRCGLFHETGRLATA